MEGLGGESLVLTTMLKIMRHGILPPLRSRVPQILGDVKTENMPFYFSKKGGSGVFTVLSLFNSFVVSVFFLFSCVSVSVGTAIQGPHVNFSVNSNFICVNLPSSKRLEV